MLIKSIRLIIATLLAGILFLPSHLLAAPYGRNTYDTGLYSADNPTSPPPCGKPGDLNNDCKVDIFDLSILLSRYGTNDSSADLNKNGTVDIFDLSILLSNYGT